jgi:hypothetical protein
MIHQTKVRDFLAKNGMQEPSPIVWEHIEMKFIEMLEDAIKRAKKEGRAFLEPQDIRVREATKRTQVVRRKAESTESPSKPIITRHVERLGGFIRMEGRDE